MPRGVTNSQYSLRERKRIAFDLFTKGFTNEQVAQRLSVHPGTVTQYREEYEEELAGQLRANPSLLRNVLENTMRALNELEAVRRAAWEEYHGAEHHHHATCPECEHEFETDIPVSHVTTRNQLLNTITKAQEQRGKLLGLFGVKQEFLLHVQSVRLLQEAILAFMRSELCAADKAKLEAFILEELGEHVRATENLPALAIDV